MPPGQMELLAGAGCEGKAAESLAQPSGLRNTYRVVLLRWNCCLFSHEGNLMGCFHRGNWTQWHSSFHISVTRGYQCSSCGDMVLIPASRLQLCHLESCFHINITSSPPLFLAVQQPLWQAAWAWHHEAQSQPRKMRRHHKTLLKIFLLCLWVAPLGDVLLHKIPSNEESASVIWARRKPPLLYNATHSKWRKMLSSKMLLVPSGDFSFWPPFAELFP